MWPTIIAKQISGFTSIRKEKSRKINDFYFAGKWKGIFPFSKKLENDEIIRPMHPDYPRWKQWRREYDQLISKDITINYGFRPAYHRLCYLFCLHVSRWRDWPPAGQYGFFMTHGVDYWDGWRQDILYGFIYWNRVGFCSSFLAGIFQKRDSIHWCFQRHRRINVAFAVLYGRKKVRIFYSLGFFFSYLHIKAIYLLPFWIANALYRLFFGGISHVADIEHVGGLITGAVLDGLILNSWVVTIRRVSNRNPTIKRLPG